MGSRRSTTSFRSIQFSDRGSDFAPEEASIHELESIRSSVYSIGAGDRYALLPLSREKREVRLLQLLPSGDAAAPLECKLYVVSRSDGPIYTALSYAWGNHHHVAPIYVNGLEWFVTENLHHALSHIRDNEEPVTLWVDAICIDQKNDEEKSWHVQQMRDTFAEASNTLAWLGKAVGTDEAMKMLHQIGDAATALGSSDQIWSDATCSKVTSLLATAADKTSTVGPTDDPLLQLFRDIVENNINGLHFPEPVTLDIFSLSWWKRTWVVQELAVASNLEFLCGNVKVPEPAMARAALIYYQWQTSVWAIHRDDEVHAQDIQKRLLADFFTPLALVQQAVYAQFTTRWAYQAWNKAELGLPLAYILSSTFAYGSTRVLEATDPRDYTFALLGLATDSTKLGLVADYSKSNAAVYASLAHALIQHGHLIALSWCRSREARHNLPSWVPDLSKKIHRPFQWVVWSAKQRTWVLEPSYAAGIGLPAPAVPLTPASSFNLTVAALSLHRSSQHTLQIPGIMFDTVSFAGTSFDELHVRSMPDSEVVTRTCIRFLKELKALLNDSPSPCAYHDESSKANAVWRTAVTDVSMALSWARQRWSDELSARHFHLYEHDFPYDEMMGSKAGDLEPFYTVEDSANSTRRPFTTAKGYLGLGPAEVLPGDQVVVFVGAQMPHICRRGLDGQLRLVGDSYVHGIMDGQLAMMDDLMTQQLVLH